MCVGVLACSFLPCWWRMLLSSILAFGNAAHAAVNATTALYYEGHSANINCNCSPSNDTDIIRVILQKNNNELCSYLRMKSWKTQPCSDHIRFIWIPESNETLFELSNLQMNDSGTYSCTVRRLTPPPEEDLWTVITTLKVIVPPVLLMSCVKRPNGSPIILCSSEGFDPAALKQQWMKDGQTINSSYSHKHQNYSTDEDGLFTQNFYLELPPQMFNEIIYTCWVNHSSLNEPLMVNLSSTACYERSDETLTVIVALITSAVLIVFVIIVVICTFYGRAQHQSAIEFNVTPEPVVQTDLQSLYSSLGDHHPVPCSRSPSGVWSPLNTD